MIVDITIIYPFSLFTVRKKSPKSASASMLAFTLVELLVVIAIISVLALVGSTIFGGLSQQTPRSGAQAYKSALDLARARAFAMHSYARVATASLERGGNQIMAIGVFVSSTGLNSEEAKDWKPVSSPYFLKNIMAKNPLTPGVVSMQGDGNLPNLSLNIEGNPTTFSGGVLFSPSGLAMGGSNPASYLGLSFTHARKPEEKSTEIIISANTGTSLIYLQN